eukprot:3805622-Alexandrium_andersonii.AAC.1
MCIRDRQSSTGPFQDFARVTTPLPAQRWLPFSPPWPSTPLHRSAVARAANASVKKACSYFRIAAIST